MTLHHYHAVYLNAYEHHTAAENDVMQCVEALTG